MPSATLWRAVWLPQTHTETARQSRKAVFLDRDGTLIRDTGYLSDPDQLELLPGVIEALKLLRKLSLRLVLISNQSGVGRRLLGEEELWRVHAWLVASLAAEGVSLDGVYYCLHAPWHQCNCRKPAPGLLLQASHDLSIDLAGSYMVGDKMRDVTAGQRAGCAMAILLDSQHSKPTVEFSNPAHVVLPDLLAAACWIQTDLRKGTHNASI